MVRDPPRARPSSAVTWGQSFCSPKPQSPTCSGCDDPALEASQGPREIRQGQVCAQGSFLQENALLFTQDLKLEFLKYTLFTESGAWV